MKKEWKSLRITLLLYAAILIVPLGMWFNYQRYDDLRQTAYAISDTMKIQEGLLVISSTAPSEKRSRDLAAIDKDVKQTGKWVEEHRNDRDYVGGRSLEKQYDTAYKCWQDIYKHNEKIDEIEPECLKRTHSLIFALERMYILKQDRFEHILFLTGAVLVFILLLTVYLIRLYLYHQSKEHAIYNLESNLYNRKFLEEIYSKMCANVKRYDKVLSVMTLHIPMLGTDERSLPKEKREKILHSIGEILWKHTRDSDAACHIEEESFVILMPETSASESKTVEERLEKEFSEKLGREVAFEFTAYEVSDEQSCTNVSKIFESIKK